MDQQHDSRAAIEFPAIAPPSERARDEARGRHAELIKPAGSLGRLEELGVWLAACQAQSPPHTLGQPRVVAFAADHGIAQRDVSAFPREATAELIRAARSGGTALDVLADVAGAGLRVVDLALDTPEDGEFKIRRRSGAIDVEDALTTEETAEAVRAGVSLADTEVDSGADLLVPAVVGVGCSTPAATLAAALTGTEPVAVVGYGSGIDDHAWMRKATAVRDALRRTRGVPDDVLALLRTVGGADLAALTGFLAQAALRRTPVLLDGLGSAVAALLAERLAPGSRAWQTAAHRGREPAQALALDELELNPILDLNISLEQSASAALPLLRMAARVLGEMRTYEETGVHPPS